MDVDLLQRARRAFVADEHIVNVLEGGWLPLFEEDGTMLVGIRGKAGAFGKTIEGQEIGGDLIEMQPGSSFGTHVHAGDHLLYCIAGEGQVYIEGRMRHWRKGDTVFIAADYPHGVTAYGVDHYEAEGFEYVTDGYESTDVASGREVHQMHRPVHAGEGGPRNARFLILAVGVPHKRVDARDRMRRITNPAEEEAIVERIRAEDAR